MFPSTKRRPALVVSPDGMNRRGEDVILAAVTSQLIHAEFVVRVSPDGSLPKESLVRLNKLFTLHCAMIFGRLCRRRENRMEEVLAGLRRLYSRVRPKPALRDSLKA